MVDVSILIPTKNGERYIAEVLDQALHRQQTDRSLEAIVLDSGSRDRTRELAAKAGAIVREIPPETFNHGLTRNLLAEQARGNYLVYLTQDATPANEHWLESLLRPLDAEILLAGVYSAHRPRSDCDPVTSYLIRQVWALAGESFPARTNVIANWQEYRANLGSYVYFANTSSAIRRSVWQETPFREVSFAEDADWARRVLEAGYLTRFEPRSVVVHSHTYRIPDLFRRNFEHAQAFQEMFGPTDRRSLAQRLAEAIELAVRIGRAGERAERGQRKLVLRALAVLFAQELGAWLGAHPNLVPERLRRRLELQRSLIRAS